MTQKDPWLLTPGPLTTSIMTKEAMLHDWGSRDASFIKTNEAVRSKLLQIIDGENSHVCIPIQGSGTFIIEATIATLVPRDSKALVLINGAYGKRIAKILDYLDREYDTIETSEDVPPSIEEIGAKLSLDESISHVLVVHCETTSGILNPIEEIGSIVDQYNRRLIIDSMSAFGAIPISSKTIPFDAIVASSNKCLEGVPGIGFALIQKKAINKCEGNAHSLSLDLYDQWMAMETNGQWRFTPPTHVIMALSTAIKQFVNEGGVLGRNERYSNNCNTLISGMKEMGFETMLPLALQAPIIVTFKVPKDPNFNFNIFYELLKDKNFIIYPGKLTSRPSFRIGCIGNIGVSEIEAALGAIADTLSHMKVANGSP